MVQRNISAGPGRVKQWARLERAAGLAAGLAAVGGESAADRTFDHVVDLARWRAIDAPLLLLPARRLAAVTVDLAQQAKPEPDGADDGDQNQQLAEAGESEHPAI